MKKSGFVFVETIVVITILTASLMLLYSTFNKILQTEKTRTYYDDSNYIYRTYNVLKLMDNLNLNGPLSDLGDEESSKYFITIGVEYDSLFTGSSSKSFFGNVLRNYEIKQMILVKSNKINNIKKCKEECSNDASCLEHDDCNMLYTNLSSGMISYLKSINIELDCPYILAIEYEYCKDSICKNYYSWVGVS